MKIIFILILFSFLELYAFSNEQITNLRIAKSIGEITVANDGMTFEKTLCSIMLRESSARNLIVGDDRKNGKRLKLEDSSIGVMQVRVLTVREVSKRVKSLNWVNKLSNSSIARLLKNNNQFNILICAHYIRMNYNYALKKKMWNPLFKTISRYNGGWYNKTYYKKVMKDMKQIEKLINKGIL